jgi:SdrD B-like protein
MQQGRSQGTVGRPPNSRGPAGHPVGLTVRIAAMILLVSVLAPLSPISSANAATTCPAAGCAVTVDARDYALGTPGSLDTFNYIINVDNTKLPNDPLAVSTESHSPIVAEGNQARPTVNLPAGRYLISVRSLDHKMWGKHITLPNPITADGSLTARIDLTEQSETHPLPLGKLRVFVFNDNAWTNGAPDTEEGGLGGFKVGLEEQTHNEVTVDYNNDPLCGGVCLTDSGPSEDTLGFVTIPNLGPATYFIDVTPPDSCDPNDPSAASGPGQWFQTTTIDGGLQLWAPVEEGSDGTGAPGEQLWEPPTIRTAYWFGFVCSPMPFVAPGTGEITGTARNWVGWPPFDALTLGEPIENPFVALSDSTTDRVVYVDQGDAVGNFDIQNVPAGSYNLSIWDEQLSYIMGFKPVTVGAGQTVDVNEEDPVHPGEFGIGVSRWFGWLGGHVYKDLNGNGVRDPGEPGIADTDMDQRWRDGSIKEATFTDPSGYYEYPTAEGGPLGRWIINEQGFGRFGVTGASRHDEYNPNLVTHVPTDQGGALLANTLLVEGHRETVDWGKIDYPPNTPGQIVGVTYWATTRNEFRADLQAHEDYEPGIPDVTVYLEGLGPDLIPNTNDDVLLNAYVTDHWQQPNASQTSSQPGWSQGCEVLDASGNDISGALNPAIGPNCLEVPITGEQTKDGAFDGGYAFADYCPEAIGGFDTSTELCANGSDPGDHPLVAGKYIVHSIMPKDSNDSRACNPANPNGYKNISDAHGSIPGGGQGCLYRIVREEDVNVDLGNHFIPAIPPPPCVGDDHVIDQRTLVTRSPYFGNPTAHAPLCDKHLVVLQNGQNFNADFNMMTNFPTDPNGENPSDVQTGDVHEPGRLVGQVFNDIYFERDPASIWYGEPRPIGGIPVGIYARVDTVPNANPPFDADHWRLFTTVKTSPDGTFEVLLPSTETFNCPIPQGPCPGMYLVTVDDPGTKEQPNPTFNPNLLVATTPADVWPGLTTQLDLPLDPISGTACEDPAIEPRPELLQVSRPYVLASNTGTARRITISADFIGTTGAATNTTGVRATLTDVRNGQVQTLTRANGGIVSWVPSTSGGNTPDTIVIQVPAIASTASADANPSTTFRPGPKQLTLTTADVNGGVSSVNGITVHVLGFNGTGANAVGYTPPIVNVPPPAFTGPNAHAIQNAIDAAAAGSLLVLSPGVYNENVLLWKPLKLQGLGAGGVTGAHEVQARDPEDPRFLVLGSVIDGRYFQQNAAAFDATVSARGPFAVDPTMPDILRGADITAVAKTAAAYNLTTGASGGIFSAARIDGIGLMTGQGDGAGGVQLQANINNMQITNNVLENNGGVVAGGIGVGQPYAHQSHNYNVRIANDRVIGNGGLALAGGVGIFYGSNNYELKNSVICSNFSVVYGAGVAHIGLSPGGSIHDNQIYYNDSVDSGAGIAIETELPTGGCTPPLTVAGCLGDGSGAVNIDRNLIQSNYSGDDGGGIFVLDALQEAINIRNNMIVDNGSAHLGGAIDLDDSTNVRIINNTVANNVTTASGESSQIGVPHAAGLTSEGNDPVLQATLPAGSSDFSNPRALFNNIFWNNNAFTLDQFGPGASLVDQGFIDFEVAGTTNNADTFTPRFSNLTNGQILGPDGVLRPLPAGQGNISLDPLFVQPFTLELTLAGSRLDPQFVAVTITGADPPVGLTGDYHLTAGSPMVDRGAGFSNLAVVAPQIQTPIATSILAPCSGTTAQSYAADFDRQFRPQLRINARARTPWDLGADELPGTGTPPPRVLPIPGTYAYPPTGPVNDVQFNWNNAGHPLCSVSTETR